MNAYLAVHILCIVLAVDVAARRLTLERERGVAHLRRKPVFEIQQACLTHVLYLCASLADYSGLEARARTRVPAENSERPGARTARTTVLLF